MEIPACVEYEPVWPLHVKKRSGILWGDSWFLVDNTGYHITTTTNADNAAALTALARQTRDGRA